MNYTDKYLVKTISNKQFKRRYSIKSKWGNKRPGREGIARETWMQKILRKNPWLKEPEPIFDSLQPEDQAHLDSIREGRK